MVAASFGKEAHRRDFLDLAARWGVPAALFSCHAKPSIVPGPSEARCQDASDAGRPIYLQAAARWESVGSASRHSTYELDSRRDPGDTVLRAIGLLRSLEIED